MKTKQRFATAGLVAALTAAGAAVAQTLPKEGSYDYTACWSGTNNVMDFSKTHTANTYEMSGTILSNPAGGLLDRATYRCLGIQTSFDGKQGGGNVCEAIDRDGDKRLSRFSLASDGKVTREVVTGTGKYEGMVENSKVSPLGPFPVVKAGTFQGCNHQTGTYKLK